MNFNVAEGEDHQGESALVATTNAYDIALVRPKFNDYRAEAVRIAKDAKSLTVDSQESLNAAVIIGGNAKRTAKAIDAKRKEIILEPSEFVKSVNGLCKMITDQLDEAERTVKQMIGQHQAQVELDRRKQEAAARKAAEELQAKLRAEAEEANRKAREEAARKAEEETRARLAKEAEERAKREAESKAQAEERAKREAAEIEAARNKAQEEAAKHEIEAPTVLAPVIPAQEKVTRTETGTSAHPRKVWTFEVLDVALVPTEYKIVDEQAIRDGIKMGIREIPGVRIYEETKTIFRS
jgi:hypothetical protein